MLEAPAQVKDELVTSRLEPARETGLRRRAATLASVLALIALLVGSFFGDRGILHLLSQRERALALERELTALRAENLRLAEDIRSLRSEPAAVERLAREQLGLARPGEIVFLIRDDASEGR
jgi:cell division protein FtsB